MKTVAEICWYCKKKHKPENWCVEKFAAMARMRESLKTGQKPKRLKKRKVAK